MAELYYITVYRKYLLFQLPAEYCKVTKLAKTNVTDMKSEKKNDLSLIDTVYMWTYATATKST